MSSTVSEQSTDIFARLADRPGAQCILLSGAEGAGQAQIALTLSAKWLGIEEKRLERCVDFQAIRPWGPSRLIKIEAVKDVPAERKDKTNPFDGTPLQIFFRTRPLMYACKCMVLFDVDRLTPSAANGLLKTLEELPDHGRVILVTSNLGMVIPTIRSRCLCLAIDSPPLETLEGDLTAAQAAFFETPGELELYRQSPDIFESLYQVLASITTNGPGYALRAAELAREAGSNLATETKVPAREANATILLLIARWAQKKLDPEFGTLMAEAHRLIQGNVNAQMVFDEAFAKLSLGIGTYRRSQRVG